MTDAQMMLLDKDNAVCFGGRWHGWLFKRHPDGNWVSVRKLEGEAIKTPKWMQNKEAP